MVGILVREDFDKQPAGQSLAASPSTIFSTAAASGPTIMRDTDAMPMQRWQRLAAANAFNTYTYAGAFAGSTAFRRWRWGFTLITDCSTTNNPIIQHSIVGTQVAQIVISTGRTFRLRDAGSTGQGVASAAVTLGVRYTFEWALTGASSQQRLFIFNPDGSTFYDSGTVTGGNGLATTFRQGNSVSATMEYWIDHLVMSDDVNVLGAFPRDYFGVAA